jgi:hypothetical protein
LPAKVVEPPSRKVHIDVRLDEIVLRALEKEPELRFQKVSQVKTMVETITDTRMPSGPTAWPFPGSEYRSKTTLWGLPLLHVTSGWDPRTRKVYVSKGIIAIGGRAKGVVAMGGAAMGIFAFGGCAVGVFAFGGCALGLITLGGLAIGLLGAMGGGAIAPIALGGGAIGYFAYGGGAYGAHILSAVTKDPVAAHFFSAWGTALMSNMMWYFAAVMVFAMVLCIGAMVCLQKEKSSKDRLTGSLRQS